jgi:hypothetical protein
LGEPDAAGKRARTSDEPGGALERYAPSVLVGSRNRGILLLGAALVTALSGHWVANILFDRDQYAGASPSLLGHLNDPVLVQTVLVCVALAALAIWGRSRGRRRVRPLLADLGRLQLVGVLVAAQLCLFVGMEVWERLAIASICCEQVHVGAFGAGFVAELLVAVGSAIAIAVFGAATARVVQLLRIRAPQRAARLKELPARREFVRLPQVLAGTGGVRAPPSLAHSRGRGRSMLHPSALAV